MVERRILEWQLPAAKRARSTTAIVNQVNFLQHPYSPNPKPNANFNLISPAMWRLNGLPGADATGGRLASSKARWGLGAPPSTSTTVSVLMFEFLTIPSWGPPHFGGGVWFFCPGGLIWGFTKGTARLGVVRQREDSCFASAAPMLSPVRCIEVLSRLGPSHSFVTIIGLRSCLCVVPCRIAHTLAEPYSAGHCCSRGLKFKSWTQSGGCCRQEGLAQQHLKPLPEVLVSIGVI